MGYLINKIDRFSFIAIEGHWNLSGQQMSVISRPGVKGLKFSFEGFKAEPFALITYADCDSLDACKSVETDYKTLLEAGAIQIQKNSVFGPWVKVLNITPLANSQIQSVSGNRVSSLAKALLICQWELVALDLV